MDPLFPRLTHIALHVKDMDACVAFYQYYCDMEICHARNNGQQRIVWLAESGLEKDFIFVLMDGGRNLALPDNDYRHFGFAMPCPAGQRWMTWRNEPMREETWFGRPVRNLSRSVTIVGCGTPMATMWNSAMVSLWGLVPGNNRLPVSGCCNSLTSPAWWRKSWITDAKRSLLTVDFNISMRWLPQQLRCC